MSSWKMLVSDLDGTLLGDVDALQAFLLWHQATTRRCRLVYATGRLIDDARRVVEAEGLPAPDAIISGVGTEIAFGAGPPIADWPVVEEGAWHSARVREALSHMADLELQPAAFQSAWKVSYYAHRLTVSRLRQIETELKLAGLQANVLYSSGRDLDVLPGGIDKGSAARWLADQWKIPPQQVIACGDSGNDLPLFKQGFLGVVVENALPELRELTGPGIYHARMGFAAGVVEGMGFWT